MLSKIDISSLLSNITYVIHFYIEKIDMENKKFNKRNKKCRNNYFEETITVDEKNCSLINSF